MRKWSIELIEAAEDELADLPADMKARFLHIAEMVEELGPHRVGMPHLRHLEGDLWEMRMKGRDGISRTICFSANGRRVVVVRVFVKKTEKTPRREIDLAYKRMMEFKHGEEAQRR
jgi:phage-related protein